MKGFVTGLLATILTLVLLSVAFIAMYTNVDSFKEMADYAMSSFIRTDEAIKENEEEVEEPAETEEPTPVEEFTKANTAATIPIIDGYIAPPMDDLEIPEEVSGRASLESVHEYSQTISDEKADQIEATLGTGNTGEEYTFDSMFYPYYHMINRNAQTMYKQIYANALDKNPQFRAVIKDVEIDDAQSAFLAVYYDHPELYWLDKTFYTYYRKNGDFIELDLVFNGSENSSLDLTPLMSSGDNYYAEKYAHDSLANHTTYSYASPRNQSAYSAIEERISVCAGYSRAFQYAMQQQGIPCYFCVGFAGEPHAWNIIYLDGDYYNVDVTWDDTDDSRGNTYDYFNKTDSDFAPTHIRQGMSINLPACNGTQYRNLEKNPEEEVDLSQYGLSEDSVFTSLSDYSTMMKDILDQAGDYEFYALISNDLYDPLFDAIKYHVIDDEVMLPAIQNLGLSEYSYYLTPTELPNGMYLIQNRVIIR